MDLIYRFVVMKIAHFFHPLHAGEPFMNKTSEQGQCSDPTQELRIEIPCRLAERIEAYAKQTGTHMAQVMIEAVDEFLRERVRRG
jgi:hypothetical protein